MTIILASEQIYLDGEIAAGWIEINGSVISALGRGTRADAMTIPQLIAPGFVDMHGHGGGGFSYSSADVNEIHTAITTHRAHGSTSLIASLVTEPLDALASQIDRLLPFFDRSEILGIHLEGPYLSSAQCGAHDPTLLRSPNVKEIAELVARGEGAIRMLTIAPELPGALEAIDYLVSQGIVVAIGHSDANAVEARAAFDRGATVVTHFFSGMRPLHHRQAPFSLEALLDDEVTLELILDGHHVVQNAVELVRRVAGDRIALITDAMAAAGAAEGEYKIGALRVHVADGVARLEGSDALAGSTLTLDRAFKRAVEVQGFTMSQALYALTTRPAAALNISDVGALARGKIANLLLLDGSSVARVMHRGEWL
jgi:N-acetylglucosamine-6-phosphate deacetylase